MSEAHVYPVTAEFAKNAHIDKAKYEDMYGASINDSEAFWADHGKRIDWIKPYTKVRDVNFKTPGVSIKWFYDGTLNASANCLDRHLETRGDQIAIIWEGDDPAVSEHVTYRDLHERVCRLSNAMKARGVKKGDRVTLYMPMVVEAAVAMLACTRIGAVHSIVFGGFSPDSLSARIIGCDSNCVITADEGLRGGKKVPLKANTDEALKDCPSVETVIVVNRTGGDVNMQEGRDVWYEDVCAEASPDCPPEEMNAEDPMFILYTSGLTFSHMGVVI
ncbi:MAG: AMP-binding protein, partial [Rhodospirillales bacterium]